MSNINYITNLCHDIHKKGKTPSVGLIRNLSNRPLPIPEVIKGLQRWKANPQQGRKDIIEQPDKIAPLSLEARVGQLEKQLKKVTQELATLKTKP